MNKTGNTWNELFCVFPFFEGGIYALRLLFLCEAYVFPDTFVFMAQFMYSRSWIGHN